MSPAPEQAAPASGAVAGTALAGAGDAAEPTRQCGRCRALFPVGDDYEAGTMPDWWLCPPCRIALLGRNA